MLKPDNWEKWMRKFRSNLVIVELPRFKTEYLAEVSDVLVQLGLGRVFDDFESLSPAVENPEGARLDQVLQALDGRPFFGCRREPQELR